MRKGSEFFLNEKENANYAKRCETEESEQSEMKRKEGSERKREEARGSERKRKV
jgi:hypothetical protein